MKTKNACMPPLISLACTFLCALSLISLLHGASAQSSECSTALTTLQPCYNYIAAGNTTAPAADCCNPLSTIIQSSNESNCICQIPTLAKSFGIAVNETRALEIARECNVTVPQAISDCLQSTSPSPTSSVPGSSTSPPSTTNPGPPSSDASHGAALSLTSILLGFILVASPLYLGMPV